MIEEERVEKWNTSNEEFRSNASTRKERWRQGIRDCVRRESEMAAKDGGRVFADSSN